MGAMINLDAAYINLKTVGWPRWRNSPLPRTHLRASAAGASRSFVAS
jgi:hypothetical protein